jgi:hypothetical protein
MEMRAVFAVLILHVALASPAVSALSAPQDYEENGVQIIPCSALLHNPSRLDELGDRLGSKDDCARVLPPLPLFDRLLRAADTAYFKSNECQNEGTIVLDMGAEVDRRITGIRINVLKQDDSLTRRLSPAARIFYEAHALDASMAEHELAKYYVSYFHLRARVAAERARSAVKLALAGSFDVCQ